MPIRALLLLSASAFAVPTYRDGCRPPSSYVDHLPSSPGYLQFLETSELEKFKRLFPAVENPQVQAALLGTDTIWYDEASMVYSYQDSIESVVGLRANCVARAVGESFPAGNPIHKLTRLFGPDFKFLFPFRTVAGTDSVTNIKTLNFWVPPSQNGKRLPVKYWRPTGRSRWRWVFPVGTLFGEVLFEKDPTGQWVVFEIRTRERYLDGWAVDVFRPFCEARRLADSIEQRIPDWNLSLSLSDYVRHLRNPQTLTPHRLESKAYGAVFPPIEGSLDKLPNLEPAGLLTGLMTETPFKSCEGKIWKENGRLETYAPSSQSDFNIVPKNYELGLIAVNEISCTRCHSETGRRLGDFEFDVQLYGEVWGEDRIFTWHLFKPNNQIFGTFDDSDGSRRINPRLISAGLVQNSEPIANEPFYRKLISAFDQPLIKPAP